MRINYFSFTLCIITLLFLGSYSSVRSQELVAIAESGGNEFNGTIFKYDVVNDQVDVLYKFDSLSRNSFANLYEAKDGKLYGTNQTKIFSFDLNSREYKIEYDLDTLGYDYLVGDFIYKNETSFYGVGQKRDSSRYGSLGIFEYDFTKKQAIHLFQTDSTIYAAQLTLAKEGVFVGCNGYGGTYDEGTMFKIDLNLDSFKVLLNFSNEITGRTPTKPFVAFGQSVFAQTYYGYQDPTNPNVSLSTIVGYDLKGDSMIFSFRLLRYTTGYRPSPFIEVDSVLYSISYINPTIFSFSQKRNTTVPFGFSIAPDTILGPEYITDVSNGLFYGVSTYGGSNSRGGIFSFDPISQSWNYLRDFTLEQGDLSRSKFLEISECTGINRTIGYTGSGLASAESNAIYQWLDMNTENLIAGENEQYYIPQDTGLFAVEIRKGNCIDTSNSIKVRVVSIQENRFSSSITIYPNPSNGKVNIDRENNFTLEYQIFNIQGKLIKRGQLRSKETQIELPEAAGLYFIQIEDEQGRQAQFKLVKQ